MTKEQWSVPTWFFFHGFAARIDEQFYKNNYKKIWNTIYKNICSNLPCPVCNYHANLYISNLNYNEINTKDKLIRYLFNFHNSVNKRLNKSIYKFEDLDKYKYLKMSKTYVRTHNNIIKDYFGSKIMNGWSRKKGMKVTLDYLILIWKNIH